MMDDPFGRREFVKKYNTISKARATIGIIREKNFDKEEFIE
jgi:hypothetical protein